MSAIEWYRDNLWFKLHQWAVKHHINRTEYINCEGETCYPKCVSCNKDIKYGEKAFRCLSNPLRIRPHGYCKICLKCSEIIKDKYEQVERMK